MSVVDLVNRFEPLRRARRRSVLVGLLTLALAAMTPIFLWHDAPSAGSGYAFGTLRSLSSHAAEESRRGIKVAMVEFSWRLFEPRPGEFDASYAAEKKAEVATMLGAGRRVTLGMGLHDPPAWVAALPNSRFVDEHGVVSSEIDLVFNQDLRRRAEEYLRHVADTVPLSQVWGVRVTSGGSGEVLYPAGGRYWAFGPNAQNGKQMPSSMAPNPAPGWRPGTKTVSLATVGRWADWYIHALDDVVGWQISTLNSMGFRGWFQVLTPGQGVSPAEYKRAIAAYLPDGLLAVGPAWYEFYTHLPTRTRVVAYVTSMADESGNDDNCEPSDRSVSVNDPAIEQWSATRWISRIADEEGLAKNGENPGWGIPQSLDSHYQDTSSTGMMAASIRQMQSCRFQGMYWAHDDQLWDGISSFERFASLASQVNGEANGLPPTAMSSLRKKSGK